MTCSWTSFSKPVVPSRLICEIDMRTTQSKLGVSSTSAWRSKSGGIGSNFAWGCIAVGILAAMLLLQLLPF